MKKLLALVLALVMTLSLAVVGSNAAFKDADKVNETYAEAVDVLAGMKVFQGYTDGSFQPEGSITARKSPRSSTVSTPVTSLTSRLPCTPPTTSSTT